MYVSSLIIVSSSKDTRQPSGVAGYKTLKPRQRGGGQRGHEESNSGNGDSKNTEERLGIGDRRLY